MIAPTVSGAGDITYAVDQVIGPGTVTGFITTDGTIGTLTAADLLNWNLELNDGTNASDLIPSNSTQVVIGSDLTASAMNLMFNYGASGMFYLYAPSLPF